MKTVKGLSLFVLVAVIISLLSFGLVWAVTPFGADITENVTTRAVDDLAEWHDANAGNVTYMTIYGRTVTQTWQGYYGNISGTIVLADNNNKVLYNWSLMNPEGEVYATENGSGQVQWGDIACFDFANNYSALETYFDINSSDVDGINETFSEDNNHEAFFTANHEFVAGACVAAYMFNDTGLNGAGAFEEVLLTDQTDDMQVIFTALIEEGGATGFDGNNYDFEMIVLENGHLTDTAYRLYYFYVELE